MRYRDHARRAALAVALVSLTAWPADRLAAQVATAPTLGAPPTLHLPRTQTATLANGLKLYVVPMHEVPLVQVLLRTRGGGREDQRRPGLASFTANMLDEGADTLDAFGIAAQAEYLGAQLSTGADWDHMFVSLKAPKRNLAPALALMGAVALRPTFRASEIARQRDLRLAGILQQRDQPAAVASLAFNALVFPAGHPYHAPLGGDSAATAALDSAMVRDFYRREFVPAGADLIVTGDITLAEARALAQRYLGAWTARAVEKGRGQSAAADTTAPVRPTTVYLVDKPGAAQSVIMIGAPGVERTTPDYAAIEVMNTILGGSFSSRLNQTLRETKGYTYGAGSGFAWRPLPGPFLARAAVRTDVTDSSLVEFFRELRGIRDSLVAPGELERAKNYLALGLGGDFETTSQMAVRLADLVDFDLPLNYYDSYVQRILAVTREDVQRVAQRYVRPDQVSVVVVGDVAKIRPGIEALKLGPVSLRDMQGNEVKATP
ncbi:MAG TPA: pitrilysin family protein [Gemmatimonadales bacterium]|nr:pitrilysin family protein [Gemmatimonadales bacterium]